jgi:hypothetical protein
MLSWMLFLWVWKVSLELILFLKRDGNEDSVMTLPRVAGANLCLLELTSSRQRTNSQSTESNSPPQTSFVASMS